ncbi:MAG: Maf family protein [Desulfobacterales bacterium]|nr:Maf family protein [Desulfobacterales bacterium]
MNSLTHKEIILASQSPRRKALLEQMGITLDICPAHIDETIPPGYSPEKAVTYLAAEKARALAQDHPDKWIISADTVVVLGNRILGKPDSKAHAVDMISALSGNDHYVFTGFCVANTDENVHQTQVVKTRVRFKSLSREQIHWYASTEEPYDKAGGYGIQGIGTCLVREIEGSYSNVVGLPMCELMEMLIALNVLQIKDN